MWCSLLFLVLLNILSSNATHVQGDSTSEKLRLNTKDISYKQRRHFRSNHQYITSVSIQPTSRTYVSSRSFKGSSDQSSVNSDGNHIHVYAIILLACGSICCIWLILLFYCWRRHVIRLNNLYSTEKPRILSVNVKKSASFRVHSEHIYDNGEESQPHHGEG